ncbi:non-histone protein [Gryganskiella cystojenkinii]|nr:non-histone protein [Gryganskiella cystojenkinii]
MLSSTNTLPPSAAEEAKYRRKYKDLKRRVRDIEEDNDILSIKLVKAKVDIRRLRVERGLLQERLDDVQLEQRHESRSSSSSTQSPRARPTSYPSLTSVSSSSRALMPARPGRPHQQQQHQQQLTRVKTESSSKDRPSPLSLATVGGGTKVGGVSSSSAGVGVVAKKSVSNRRLKPRGPDAPRGPSNAFFIFSQMHRPEAKEVCQGNSHYELARHLGQKWKNLTPEEKKTYVNLARQDRTRYLTELEVYDKEHGTGPGASKPVPRGESMDVDSRETPEGDDGEDDEIDDDEGEDGHEDDGGDEEEEEEDEDGDEEQERERVEADVDELMDDDDGDGSAMD